MKVSFNHLKLFIYLTSFAVAAWSIRAAEIPQRSIETVMEEAMKGSNSLYRKVSLGQGSEEDVATLLNFFKSLHGETPPHGDKASWDAKTETLISAVQNVIDKKTNAISELQVAGNCKACHRVHKGN